jgi:hypothetical protein
MLCILVDVADDFDVFLIRASITGGWPIQARFWLEWG